LGANSTIVCGVTIGQYAFVGAGAVVTKDVPAHALMAGVPARRIGWACRCGVRLEMSGELWACQRCGENYSLQDGALARERESFAPKKGDRPRAMAAAAGQD
jgi:UDP-2-acetamido-3-amino-2,3-dideoxy-glucuronate N-acetyltransferase